MRVLDSTPPLPLISCELIAAFACAILCRSEEVDGPAGCGRHAGGDEGGEEEDGDGEEGLHPGALSLSGLPPAHHHFHRAAALAAALWDQRGESQRQLFQLFFWTGSIKVLTISLPLARSSTTPPASSWRRGSRVRCTPP